MWCRGRPSSRTQTKPWTTFLSNSVSFTNGTVEEKSAFTTCDLTTSGMMLDKAMLSRLHREVEIAVGIASPALTAQAM